MSRIRANEHKRLKENFKYKNDIYVTETGEIVKIGAIVSPLEGIKE